MDDGMKAFVSAVSKFPFLYDKNIVKSTKEKNKTWELIGRCFGKTEIEAFKLFTELRQKYFDLKKEKADFEKNRPGLKFPIVWHLYDQMKFLDGVEEIKPEQNGEITVNTSLPESCGKLKEKRKKLGVLNKRNPTTQTFNSNQYVHAFCQHLQEELLHLPTETMEELKDEISEVVLKKRKLLRFNQETIKEEEDTVVRSDVKFCASHMISKGLPHFAVGKVVTGFQRGSKQLGFPTANYDEHVVEALPPEVEPGVYFGWAQVQGGPVDKMVMSIGWNPFYKNEKKSMETYIIKKFENDFYGQVLKVVMLGYLRPEKNFGSVEELIAAINADVEDAKKKLDTEEFTKFRDHEFFK